jgi:hypothetical protein
MRVVDQSTTSAMRADVAATSVVGAADPGDWADETRRVLTRDLLVRAAYAPPGAARALVFRALHINLPLVAEVADRVGLSGRQLTEVEPAAIDALLEAVHDFDPFGQRDFAELAASYVEQRLAAVGAISPRTPPASPR